MNNTLHNSFRVCFVLFWFLSGIHHSIATPTLNNPKNLEFYLFSANAFDSSIAGFIGKSDVNNLPLPLSHNGHWPTAKFPTTVIANPSKPYIYVASKVTDIIDTYKINPASGKLTLLKDRSIHAGSAPHLFAISPSGKFLYVALRSGGLAAFFIDQQDGKLKKIKGSPYPTGKRTRSVVVHPNSRFVYASNAHSNTISAFSVDLTTGVLTELASSPFYAGDDTTLNIKPDPRMDIPFEAGAMPYFLSLDNSGKYLYVANWLGASLSAFKVSPVTGKLTPIEGSPFRTCFNPYAVQSHPAAAFIYVTCYEPNTVAGYAVIADTGQLVPVPNSPFETLGVFPIAIQPSPNGELLYVANYNSNNISTFYIDTKTGSLTFKDLIQTRSGPNDLTLVGRPAIKQMKTLYSAILNNKSNRLSILEPNKRSKNKLLNISSIKTGPNPIAIGIHPIKNFIYVVNNGSDSVSAYHFDPKNKRLTTIAQSPFKVGASPTAIAVDNNGQYVYVSNQASNNMSVFKIDSASGSLHEVQNSPFAAGHQPTSITLDDGIRYAYLTNSSKHSLSLFRYWTAGGPLIDNLRRKGATYRTGKNPIALDIDYSGRYLMCANAGDNTVSTFRINVQGGFLTNNTRFPTTGGGTLTSLLAHPKLSLFYTLNSNPNSIESFQINQLDGRIKTLQTKTLSLKNPQALHYSSTENKIFILASTAIVTCATDKTGIIGQCWSSYQDSSTNNKHNFSAFSLFER